MRAMTQRRRALMEATRTIPYGYTQVKCVISNGSQMIDTGINIRLWQSDRMIYRFAFTTVTGVQIVYGTNNSTAAGGYYARAQLPLVNNNLRMDLLMNTNYIYGTPSSGTILEYKIENGVTSCMGTSFSISQQVSGKTWGRLYLFAQGPDETSTCAKIKVYDFEYISQTDDFHIALVPVVQDSTGKAGLYDIISKTFFSDYYGGNFGYESL